MPQKYFLLVIQKIESSLSAQGFKRGSSKNQIKMTETFTNQSFVYQISYDPPSKKFNLKVRNTQDEETEQNWHLVSSWFFDPVTDGDRQAQSIAADFIETMGRKKNDIKPLKRRKRDEDGNVDTIFLMNRLANIFTDLKDEIKTERISYSQFRSVTFTQQKVVPKIITFLRSQANKQDIKKLANVLENLYQTGDLDVQSIITIVILNSLEGETETKLRECLNDELKKAWDAAKKLKGKKIKPEKSKRPKIYVSDTLNAK